MSKQSYWKIKLLIPGIYFLGSILIFIGTYLYTKTDFSIRQIVGITVSSISFIFWIVARIQLQQFYTIAPEAKGLITTGLYKRFRHPVYVFSILAILGMAIFLNSILVYIMFFLTIVLQVFRARKETNLLKNVFGKEYLMYKEKTWF